LLSINGVQVVAPDSYQVGIADLDASANRSGNGTLYRDRVAVKRTIEVSWTQMDAFDLSVLLTNMSSVFFPVTYLDPEANAMKTGTFYVSDRNSGVAIKNSDGSYTWKGISFSLIER
jgi:hypothetical protein